MASCEEIIKNYIKKRGVKRASDVTELCLANNGLIHFADLSGFQMLNYLWLNNNKIRDVSGLKHNHGITELYLHDNQLTSVTGALNHLKSLQVLMLHNNQLTKLEKTISELKGMQFLKTLSLFLNPLAQESPYRLYVIHHLPLLKMLDKKEIKQEEKDAAFSKYSPERFRILQSIAFGKRVESVVPNSQSRALIQHGE
ncbi:leucine-rich repeat-containing protein 72 [Erpetoichthys calabaricus]|uniref:leucine-rich repeat-containing protein 72 n=1 Tax=Erpetoichthys calabaricus TaxID=27687 RepID=UPI0022347AE7|nr:leucine-rich repeat-containing protein 72 [Erpetoichthys calabaricus]